MESRNRGPKLALGLALAVAFAQAAAAPAGAATTAARAAATPSQVKRTQAAPTDTSAVLRGGQEGTVFRAITIEGEDRIHYEVERPELRLELDPASAPGLEWGTARDVLDRTVPDAMAPLLAESSTNASPYVGRPWLSHFSSGTVAKFRPAVDEVASWKLVVANWRGEPVTTFSGSGRPPREIEWDGRATNGAPVMPGATYSYVFEATDRAGNRRNFVGEGFKVNAFRVTNDQGTSLSFTANELEDRGSVAAAGGTVTKIPTPPVLLEAASWLNQREKADEPILVTVNARSAEEAATLALRVRQQLDGLLVGDASRIGTESVAASDAPPGGVVRITVGRGRAPVATPAKSAPKSTKPAAKSAKPAPKAAAPIAKPIPVPTPTPDHQ